VPSIRCCAPAAATSRLDRHQIDSTIEGETEMTRKITCGGVVFAIAMATAAGMTMTAAGTAEARTAQTAPITTSLKGVIKSIDDKEVVIAPSNNKTGEVEFDLTSSAKREGELAPGDQVTITYYYENGKRVVTDVAGKAATGSK
jgi:hypothetical protein